MGREEIRDRLLPLINLPGLKVGKKRLFSRISELYASLRIEYVDCYHAALVEERQDPELTSYDLYFDQLPSVRRFEP